MKVKLRYVPHTLQFKFDARTSRGAISSHQVYYLLLRDENGAEGVGECAPLPGLSIDCRPDLEVKLKQVVRLVNEGEVTLDFNKPLPEALALQDWPALYFALETAMLDLQQGGNRILFQNAFSGGVAGIPINGLIWMGDKAFMQEQIKQKLDQGYNCLKLKIGGLDFATELEILQRIRETASAGELTIRVDANGAFAPEDAFKKLERLSKYTLHSIEQPIKAGQLEQMAALCAYSPVPIALDEELIGVQPAENKSALLDTIKPQFIILKPTLLGGLAASAAWVKMAEQRGIGWWFTSALESNIGLSAISQFSANYNITMPQGLGTGQLYNNNIGSPLHIAKGNLWYKGEWENLAGLGL